MKILTTTAVYTSRYFQIIKHKIERNGNTFTKDFIVRNPTVHIIPYTSNNDIYMESQFRDALGGLALEVVAGTIEEGGDPLETAKRELHEETGLSAKTWKKIAEWDLSVNMQAKIHVYAATDLEEGKAHLDDEEEIETIKMPLDKIMDKIKTGELTAASHIASLYLFKQLREEGTL
jgi:ADP-ribose pyrophosphatase